MKAVQPLKDLGPPAVDVVGPMPYTALQQMFDPTAPWGIHSYWKTEYLLDLSEDVTSVLLDRAARLGSPFSAIHVHHLEGAVNRESENATAFGRRDVRYIVNAVGLWMDPGMHEPEVQWVRESWQALQPFSAGGVYLNFMDGDEEARVSLAYGANHRRLAEVKAQYDPSNVFRLNQKLSRHDVLVEPGLSAFVIEQDCSTCLAGCVGDSWSPVWRETALAGQERRSAGTMT